MSGFGWGLSSELKYNKRVVGEAGGESLVGLFARVDPLVVHVDRLGQEVDGSLKNRL